MTHDAFFFARLREGEKKEATKLKFTHEIQLTTVSIWFMYVFPGKAAFWVAPINSVLVHVSNTLTWLWTCCSLDKGDVTINHCESRWNSEHWIQTASPWCYIYIYTYIYRKMSKPVDRDMAANDRDIPINDRDMAAIDRDIPVIDRDMACASEKLELAPINSGLVHVSKILTWLGTFCSLDKWNATMDHFESRWNSSKNWTRPLQRLHPSMQALSTSPRSWLGLEPSAAWTSEMRNNYGCSRTLNTVWYGVATCGSLLLASARGSKNDNRKRYAFGPCCFLRRRHILSAADHGGLGFELETPDCGFCTPVCETNSSSNLLLSGLLISI